MLFTSYAFIGFVLLLLIVYYLIPKRYQWALLLLGSMFFYATWSPKYLIYIWITIVTTWYTGLKIDGILTEQKAYLKGEGKSLSRDEKKAYKAKRTAERKGWFIGCLFVNLGILAVVKYTNFVIDNINKIAEALGSGTPLSFLDIALPLGISYYTFMSIGYLLDIGWGKNHAEKKLLHFALFVSFFPHIVQGPISRFDDLSKGLYAEHDLDWKNITFGAERILWGFFKKLVIADRILPLITTITGDFESYHGAYSLVAMLLYSVELYADFTGGIDMTIGTAEMFGVPVTENFIRPYFSKSLKEYWRRWHITMGSWFRDYLFYPLSTSKMMQNFSKFLRKYNATLGKRLPVYVSSFLLWFATGLWHGASWNFIVWGILNFVVLMISEELEPLYDKFHERFIPWDNRPYQGFMAIRTFLITAFLKIFDCYTVTEAFKAIGSVFCARNWGILFDGSLLKLGLGGADFAVIAGGILLMFVVSLKQRSRSVREQITELPFVGKALVWSLLFVGVIIFGAYGIGYDSTQFIYNRF